jgi:N-acetylneuraminic acid mutarotase
MPSPQSEYASVTVDGKRCALSGFGDVRGFKCYDIATNAWSSRAAVPVSRDHAEAVNLGTEVLFTGGYLTDLDGPQNIVGWRYRVAEDRWEAVPQLPDISASSGAVLAGFAYFTGVSGSLYQVNPRSLAIRAIPGDNTAARDHSQLVAFQGELWLMGGRDVRGVATARVSIFDPASETWRVGPTLGSARSGFAAAASDTTIVVAGGERLDAPPRTLADVEAIVAGDGAWNSLPPLPFAMHGFGGALQGKAFYTLGGSRVAGGTANEGQVQIYRW